MYKIYCIQTFWGSRQKNFQHEWNAKAYHSKLNLEFDGCAEMYTLDVDAKEFALIDLED